MMRTIVFLVSVFCVATVLTEILGLAYLWFNGQLTASAVQDIRVALGAEEIAAVEDTSSKETVAKSNDDILKMRTERGWELQRRLAEVRILKSTVAEKAAELKADRDALEQIQQEFEQRLAAMRTGLNGEAAEQARAILIKMDAADAVSNLMAMPVEKNVLLLKGMPEKAIAAILQEFLRGNDPQQIKREQMIFEAISAGQPSLKMIDDTAKRTGGTPQTPAPPANTPN